MEDKWICNKCGFQTTEQPSHKNSICANCNKGRFKLFRVCKCGTVFNPNTYKQKYCSIECGKKYRQSGCKKGKHYPHLQRARIAICKVCGKEFRAVKDTKTRMAIYCSKECWEARAHKTIKCKYCGKEIEVGLKSRKVYCNQECSAKAQRVNQKGDKSRFWKGGKTKETKLRRTSAEYREWRLAVFNRDKFICQCCGKHTSDLEAHHIMEQSKYPELIFDINNGLTLCHACHKMTDNYGYKALRKQLNG